MKILKLWASWCQPCKTYAPIFDKWSDDNPDIDTESVQIDAQIIDKAWDIQSIPTTILVDKDYKLIEKHVGVLSPKDLDNIKTSYNDARSKS